MTLLEHVMYYHEQHRLFLFSRAYVAERFHQYGFLETGADFLMQFFYYPWLGSAVMATVLTGCYLLCNFGLQMLIRCYDWLQLSLVAPLWALLSMTSIEYSPGAAVLALVFSVALWLLGMAVGLVCRYGFHRRFKPKTLARPWLPFVISGVIGAALMITAYCHVVKSFNPVERCLMLPVRSVNNGDYQDALNRIEGYHNSGRDNQLLQYFRNVILTRQGQLPYRMMEHPQRFGLMSLYFPWTSDTRQSEYGAYMLESVGLLNDALHWENEALVVVGETAPHLVNLARYNIALGKPVIAQRYINLLKQSLFYCGEGKRLEQLKDDPQAMGLVNAFPEGAPSESGFFSNIIYVVHNLKQSLRYNPSNKAAEDLMLCIMLMTNDVVGFKNALPRDMRVMPRLYEEALMLYKIRVGDYAFAQEGLYVSPEVEKRFNDYVNIPFNMSKEEIARQFGDTYWYWMHYLSPYGPTVRDPQQQFAPSVTPAQHL